MENKREAILEATMEVVAQKGLADFSVRQAAERASVSEALIYKYFETKDGLLFACFESVHKQVAEAMSAMKMPASAGRDDLIAFVREMWLAYLDVLIRGGSRTLFYYAYCDSPFRERALSNESEAAYTYFKDFVVLFRELDQVLHIYEKTDHDTLWTYIIDVTGIFARRMIKGQIQDTPQNRESAFHYLFAGLSWLG